MEKSSIPAHQHSLNKRSQEVVDVQERISKSWSHFMDRGCFKSGPMGSSIMDLRQCMRSNIRRPGHDNCSNKDGENYEDPPMGMVGTKM